MSVKVMTAIIEARDLVKRFDGFTAVDHISFAVEAGVVFGFLGPNGAGKTTTIKMLTTVLAPSEGRLGSPATTRSRSHCWCAAPLASCSRIRASTAS